ncbi:MAG: hypothetical protein KAT83_03595, partial [Candidatus Aenigmarchaeota archaeon]|nr:hypothetical protein [Candidatus Aenigmarchaeota archaeon]
DFVFGMPEENETGDVSPITGDATAETVSRKAIYALIIGLSLVLIIFFGREFRKMSKEASKEEEEKQESDTKTPKKRGRKKKAKKAGKKGKEKSDDIKDILDGI